MLNDATCFQNVYIVCGYTDLKSGVNKLASVIEQQTGKSPFVPDTKAVPMADGRIDHHTRLDRQGSQS